MLDFSPILKASRATLFKLFYYSFFKTNNMKKIIIILASILIVFSSCDFVSNSERHLQSDVSDLKPTYFLTGDTLAPDYAHSDTLVIIDGEGLTKAFNDSSVNQSWGSDADIDNMLHQYCNQINR